MQNVLDRATASPDSSASEGSTESVLDPSPLGESLRGERELLISLIKEMMFYRRFEERVLSAYTRRKFSGFCHLHIGQEGLCAGVQRCLNKSDYMITGYRSHTQAVAKGISPLEVLSELFGKVTGCSRGKGGSMHMFSWEHRFFGGHGIVGGQAPLATGMAWKVRYQKEPDIVVCYLGDAAMNQGQVFEALNMAALWKLPVLFVIENNLYGMGTHISRTTTIGATSLYKRALAFDMDHSQVDGQNVRAVFEHVSPLVAQMREGSGPHLLEALTYRYKGHSVSDPGLYRSKEEVMGYKNGQDPIQNLAHELTARKFTTDEQIKEWDGEIKAHIKDLEQQADEAPEPDVAEAWQHVYATPLDPDRSDPAGGLDSEGRA